MATTQTMKHVGFIVPPPMEEELEQMAKEEHRTKSDMFREMVRFYRTYRKHVDQAEEEQFQRMVDEVIREAEKLADLIGERLPRVELTDLLVEVDTWVHFSEHFKHAAGGEARNSDALVDNLKQLLGVIPVFQVKAVLHAT